MKKNIAIISIHPAPYRDPVYKTFIDNNSDNYNVDVIILFPKDEGHPYQEVVDNDYKEIKLKLTKKIRGFGWHHEIRTLLKEKKYDAVLIPGYSHLTTVYVFLYCRRKHIPIIFSSDEIHNPGLKWLRKFRKNLLTKFFVSRSTVVYVPGKSSVDFISQFGLTRERIFEGSYSLDVSTLKESANYYRKLRDRNRNELNIQKGNVVFIYAGRFIKVRDILTLVKAYQKTRVQHNNVNLILIGDGDEKESIINYINDNNIEGVIFHDFVKISEISKYYTLSDVYILTSILEHYSLACIQGAICSLPLIVTDGVGAAHDVLIDGVSGYIAKSGEVNSISHAMFEAVECQSILKDMGKKSYEMVKGRDVNWAADQLEKAFLTSLKGGFR